MAVQENKIMNNPPLPKHVHVVSFIGVITACFMYVSYIPQIWDNLHGHATPALQPAVAALNCILWVWYGSRVRNWPVVIANAPGILFGIVAAMTALH